MTDLESIDDAGDDKPFDPQEFMQKGIIVPNLCEHHQRDYLLHQVRIPEEGPWRAYVVAANVLLFQGAMASKSIQRRIGPECDLAATNIVLSEIGCLACWNRGLYALVVRVTKRGLQHAADVTYGRVVDPDWQRWMEHP